MKAKADEKLVTKVLVRISIIFFMKSFNLVFFIVDFYRPPQVTMRKPSCQIVERNKIVGFHHLVFAKTNNSIAV
jgi:hypothetical protein